MIRQQNLNKSLKERKYLLVVTTGVIFSYHNCPNKRFVFAIKSTDT